MANYLFDDIENAPDEENGNARVEHTSSFSSFVSTAFM
jgi:hypothetical protein